MAARRLTGEQAARLLLGSVLVGTTLALAFARTPKNSRPLEISASMPETGGWTPGNFTVPVGEPLALRLTSQDVVHGFAVGQTGWPAVDVEPGRFTSLTLTFARPGTYTFYCTRWCGPNHWRMRGTIEVLPQEGQTVASPAPPAAPLYVQWGLDIDAPHPAAVLPLSPPDVARGAALGIPLPPELRSRIAYLRLSPAETWQTLRALPETASLTNAQVWDLAAWLRRSATTPAALALGGRLYAQNCAACHGETGAGDGVLAPTPVPSSAHLPMPDFTAPQQIFGASPALLYGKIIRGGMGTGMPAWGTIFTEEETWALVDFLYTLEQTDWPIQ